MPAAKPKVIKPCDTCGVTVVRSPSAADMRHIYCSRACTALGRRYGQTLVCEQCRSEFYRHNAEITRQQSTNNFCCKECYSRYRALNRKATTYMKAAGRGHLHLHRLVAAGALGRPLRQKEVVHHIDGDRSNNAPANLAVFPSQAYHARCHGGNMTKKELRRYALVPAAVK